MLLYQGIVLTGTHNIINMTIKISFLAGEPSMVFAVVGAAFYAQIGACISLVIITKDKSFRKVLHQHFYLH
ncbi:hypothetical protein [Mesoplasma melaleucae]|uniref:hypothetical protein n=1 Tax=Mesoplasma melaleucae TaxID=81459 RepID=UPI00048301B5|nr:hypothetical protein [Mesoplasma melaleucae]